PPRAFGRCAVPALARPNPPEYALALYGAMAAGGAVTGANPLLTAGGLAGQPAGRADSARDTVPPVLAAAPAPPPPAPPRCCRPGSWPGSCPTPGPRPWSPPRRSSTWPGRQPRRPGSA